MTAAFYYTSLEAEDGAMVAAPVTFPGGARGLPFPAFRALVAGAIDFACVDDQTFVY